MSGSLGRSVVLSVGLVLAMDGPAKWTVAAKGPSAQQQVNPEAKTVSEFMERVKEYVSLHKKLEDAAPKLPKEATPEQIDRAQRSLAALIQSARAGAKRGDVFTPDMTAFVKRVLNEVFAGPRGKELRSSIMDENTTAIPLKVNQLYPDKVPLTTMPPQVLGALPKLPEELEFRFIADQMILLDPHAHIIVDFIPAALPGR